MRGDNGMGRTIRALALPVLVLLLLVAQFPGLLRTNVELTATDRFASFAVEDLAAHFGARYSLPLMLRAVAPEADMILEGSIPLGEGGILPEHRVAIGTASTVARVGASPIVVPPALAAADVLLSGATTGSAGPSCAPPVMTVRSTCPTSSSVHHP